ncbi:MAG TPA: FlgD immunoglobulin-like domain containing protein [Verrucomicrobiae bacterium]|nr:FlgD immunoglobulin-like domain containing protein [Verrucomicrobiae bacterium]
MTRPAIGLALMLTASGCASTPHTPPPAKAYAGSPPAGSLATGTLLSEVQAARSSLEAAGRDRFTVGFRLAAPATVALRIYDEDDLLVTTVRPQVTLPEGKQEVTWDATDDRGQPVPQGVYLYTLLAISAGRRLDTYDATDATGGRRLPITEDSYDAERRVIRYSLPAPARVRIRVDLRDGGPHMRTVLDWALREAGPHEEAWDGQDDSGEIRLADHPMSLVMIRAYSIPDNALIVTTGTTAGDPGGDAASPGREHRPHVSSPVADYMHALHVRSRCHEPHFTVDFPPQVGGETEGGGETTGKTPVVSGDVPVRVTLSPADRAHLLASRFEVAIFADLMIVAEEEEGYSPFTYILPASTLGPGSHLITINVLGNDDHIGVVTRRIEVR